MRAVIQRVSQAEVAVKDEVVGRIKNGILVFLGVSKDDKFDDIEYLANKIVNLRIFQDQDGKMNRSLIDINGELLIVSQFTLYGDCKKGRRPSFDMAAKPEVANKIYNKFVEYCVSLNIKVETGIFQESMDVKMINDGPVTFIIESKN